MICADPILPRRPGPLLLRHRRGSYNAEWRASTGWPGAFHPPRTAGVRGGGARQNLVCGSARERRQGASRHLPAGFVGDTCFGAVEIAADIPARQGLVIAPPRHPMMQRHANLLAGKLGFEFRVDLPGEADGKRRRLFEYSWPALGPIGQGERNPTRRQAPFRFWIGFVRRHRIWRHLWRLAVVCAAALPGTLQGSGAILRRAKLDSGFSRRPQTAAEHWVFRLPLSSLAHDRAAQANNRRRSCSVSS